MGNTQAHSKEELPKNREHLVTSPNHKADRLTGTLYNQFYSTNPEASPIKPLPSNIEEQISNLENL